MIKEQTEKLNLSKYTEDSKEGLMLEVDPDYPQELHNIDNNHPLAAEKINVKKDILSNHCESIRQTYNMTNKQTTKRNNKFYWKLDI